MNAEGGDARGRGGQGIGEVALEDTGGGARGRGGVVWRVRGGTVG